MMIMSIIIGVNYSSMDKCRLDLTINRSKIVGLDDGKDGSN